jgi:3-hydroxybutyryl-CoA dehydratase
MSQSMNGVISPQDLEVTPQALFSTRFEDLVVGVSFTTPGRTVTETDVVNFSQWTGDTLPVHTDRHWAEQHGLYGRRIANGLLTLSYTVGLLPLDHQRIIALRRVRELVFKRPVFLDDTIHGQGRIDRLLRLDPFGCVVTSLQSVNQDGEIVMRGIFEMLWRLDPAASGSVAEQPC